MKKKIETSAANDLRVKPPANFQVDHSTGSGYKIVNHKKFLNRKIT